MGLSHLSCHLQGLCGELYDLVCEADPWETVPVCALLRVKPSVLLGFLFSVWEMYKIRDFSPYVPPKGVLVGG